RYTTAKLAGVNRFRPRVAHVAAGVSPGALSLSQEPESMTEPAEPSRPRERLDLLAGLVAAVLPGAGHVYLGEVRRGILAAVGVLGLFFGGMLLGGIDVIDSREDRLWFFVQALVGPVAVG